MSDKISSSHLARKAIVYLRQSSPAQVREHRESTNRQYGLRKRAQERGWSADAIEVIDEDLGESSSKQRDGFQHVAEEVAQGRVGGLFALEVSRLARSSADWYRLLDLAGLVGAVIGDEDFIYDPNDFNDRLVLGLKGQFAEAEIYWMRLRLQGGKMSKARRGELVFNPPIGYVWSDDNRLHFDPDEHVQRAIRLIFERYRVETSAAAVVRYFAEHGLQMPFRDRLSGKLRWTPPSYQRVLQALHNPAYAGAYVYGRRERRKILVDGEVRHRISALPLESWKVCLKDYHAGYVSWDEFMANQNRLRDSWSGGRMTEPDRRGAAREGKSLLQGLVLCGRCGKRMRTRYSGSGKYAQYECQRAKLRGSSSLVDCWQVSHRFIDEAVESLFLSVIQPSEIELSLAVARDAERQGVEIQRQWQLQLEHARYEASLAERRYKAVDPEYRPVARTLEREWNDKLEELARLEREYDGVRHRQKVVLSDEDRQEVLALARDLPKVWNAPTTTHAERKNLLRMLIRDITLSPIDLPKRVTRVQVLWVTGTTSDIQVPRPTSAEVQRTSPAAVQAIRELFLKGIKDQEIAEEMNRSKFRPSRQEKWTKTNVRRVRHANGMLVISGHQGKSLPLRREDGLYSTKGVAELLDIPVSRVYAWITQGHLSPTEGGNGQPIWFRLESADIERLRSLRASLVARGYRIRDRQGEHEPIETDEVHCE